LTLIFAKLPVIFLITSIEIMDQKIPELNLKNAIGVAGSAVLLAPFGIPIMHGVAGIAVAGATLFLQAR